MSYNLRKKDKGGKTRYLECKKSKFILEKMIL